MEIQVIEGRFVEVPTAGATGMDRCAFGEFVGPRGELASYAFGWTTGSDPHVARMTVGIGAGNPGGGTFHARVFVYEDGVAYSLVDEPFERVPQGGPDLTADQARAHVDLPFVWWVVDRVMGRDRRAWWMQHWLLGTHSIQTLEVFERREPILLVGHDADDGLWQLIGPTPADPATGKIAHLSHAVDEDPTLVDVLDLPPGHSAYRITSVDPGPARSATPVDVSRKNRIVASRPGLRAGPADLDGLAVPRSRPHPGRRVGAAASGRRPSMTPRRERSYWPAMCSPGRSQRAATRGK